MPSVIKQPSSLSSDFAGLARTFGSSKFFYDPGKDELVLEDVSSESISSSMSSFNGVVPTVLDIKKEAQKRIFILFQCFTIEDCYRKQLNAIMEAASLNDIRMSREWTAEEAAQAEQMRALMQSVKRIRTRSDELELSLPVTYQNDSHWS